MRRSAEERFWAKVRKEPGNACWVWIGGKADYPRFSLDGRSLYVHQASWILHFGPVHAGRIVYHVCPKGANSRCVRPSHLRYGTRQDAAKRKKQRAPRLTEVEVLEILASKLPNRVLAEHYGVTNRTIARIRQRGA